MNFELVFYFCTYLIPVHTCLFVPGFMQCEKRFVEKQLELRQICTQALSSTEGAE